jgi:hypothetical protein
MRFLFHFRLCDSFYFQNLPFVVVLEKTKKIVVEVLLSEDGMCDNKA